jgi:hypothetical protein
MYNPNSDVSGGWGFSENALGCEFLGRVQLSNRVLVPPSHIAFDETQDETNEQGEANFFGVGWNALPIFGGAERTDSVGVGPDQQKLEPDFNETAGHLSWTLTVDSEQFSGPLVSMVPEYFFRGIEEFNMLEDKIEWDDNGGCCPPGSDPASGTVAAEDLCSDCADWCYEEQDGPYTCPDSDCTGCDFCENYVAPDRFLTIETVGRSLEARPYGGQDCIRVGAVAARTLGMAPAKGATAFGGELLALPVFNENSGSNEYIKLPAFSFPNTAAVEPLVLDLRSYNESLYNRYLALFQGTTSAEGFETSFFGPSANFPVHPEGRFSFTTKPKDGASIDITAIGDMVKFKGEEVPSLNESGTESNAFFEWQGDARQIPSYFKRASSSAGFEPVVDENEVPAALKDQEYMETHTSDRFQAHNGRRKRDWCYDCNPADTDNCDADVKETTLGDGSLIRYRWYRFRDQPVFQQLAKEFPAKYTEGFLDNLQTVWTALHTTWGAGEPDMFLRRPKSRTDYNMARLDPGLILTPPTGKEAGWVPITLEVKFDDGNNHATKSNPGNASKGQWWRPTKNPFVIEERRVDWTGGFTPAQSNYDKLQWIDDDALGKVDFQKDDDQFLDDDYQIYTFSPTNEPTATAALIPTNAPTATSPIPTPAPTTGAATPTNPTLAPTTSPTPEATNPGKPAFIEADFAYLLTATVVDLATTTVTSFPTNAPTSYPTLVGYEMVAKQMDVKVISTSLPVSLTTEEAQHPMMQKSFKAGFAASIGLDEGKVAITHIDGTAVTRGRRRLVSAIDVLFVIESASTIPAQVQILKDNVIAAAADGSIVANMQKQAAVNGVLVESLRSMNRAISLSLGDLTESTKSVTVYEAARSQTTNEPTPTASTSLFEGTMLIIISAGGAVVLLLLLFCIRRCRRRSLPNEEKDTAGTIVDEDGVPVNIDMDIRDDEADEDTSPKKKGMRVVNQWDKDVQAKAPGKILV